MANKVHEVKPGDTIKIADDSSNSGCSRALVFMGVVLLFIIGMCVEKPEKKRDATKTVSTSHDVAARTNAYRHSSTGSSPVSATPNSVERKAMENESSESAEADPSENNIQPIAVEEIPVDEPEKELSRKEKRALKKAMKKAERGIIDEYE